MKFRWISISAWWIGGKVTQIFIFALCSLLLQTVSATKWTDKSIPTRTIVLCIVHHHVRSVSSNPCSAHEGTFFYVPGFISLPLSLTFSYMLCLAWHDYTVFCACSFVVRMFVDVCISASMAEVGKVLLHNAVLLVTFLSSVCSTGERFSLPIMSISYRIWTWHISQSVKMIFCDYLPWRLCTWVV